MLYVKTESLTFNKTIAFEVKTKLKRVEELIFHAFCSIKRKVLNISLIFICYNTRDYNFWRNKMPIIRHAHCQNPAQCQACAACNTDLGAPRLNVVVESCVCVMLITPYGPRPGGNERPPSRFGQQPSRPLPRSAVAEVPISPMQALVSQREASVSDWSQSGLRLVYSGWSQIGLRFAITRDGELLYRGRSDAEELSIFSRSHWQRLPPVNPPSQHIEARQICEHDVEGQRYLAPSSAWQCSRCGIKCQHPIDERR
jgi:hypothetical protein